MTHDHDHATELAVMTPATIHDDQAPGRGTRSNQLAAPAHPMVSSLILRKESNRDANGVADDADHAVASASSSSGHALPTPVMRKFESSLGADLSSVRVHTGAESQTAAQAVNAKAYTVGQDIHFGAGHYDPTSGAGEHLLAHEVAHTVQQQGSLGRKVQFQLEVSAPTDSYELEADQAADAMVSGTQATVTNATGVARAIMRSEDDPETKALPSNPSFSGPDGSFAAMVAALNSSMKGGGSSLSTPGGIAASQANLSATEDHARASETFYKAHSSKIDPGNINAELGTTASGDMAWAVGMLADVQVAGSATSTWVSLCNQSNTSWDDVVKVADSLSITIDNKMVAPNALAGETAPKVGDQQVNVDEVGGEGMALATAAKRAGVANSPDATHLQKLTQEYNQQRDGMANKERRVFSALNTAKVDAIQKKKAAATEDKEKWEAIEKGVDVFATGVSAAMTGGAAMEGELGAATVSDAGSKQVVVVSKGGKKGFGIQDNTAEEIIKKKETEPKEVAEKAGSMITKAIRWKIDKINALIATYDGQMATYKAVQGVQDSKAMMGDYMDGLGNLSTAAKNVEDERALMEKKLVEWGKSIDAKLAEKGKGDKNGGKDNQNASQLLAKIRIAHAAVGAAIEGLSQGSGGLPKLYSGLAKDASQKVAAEAGRGDKRATVFGIESRRWAQASSAIDGAAAALNRRQDQLTALQTKFLETFGVNSGGIDGAGSPGTKF